MHECDILTTSLGTWTKECVMLTEMCLGWCLLFTLLVGQDGCLSSSCSTFMWSFDVFPLWKVYVLISLWSLSCVHKYSYNPTFCWELTNHNQLYVCVCGCKEQSRQYTDQQKNRSTETQDVYVENPEWEKPLEPIDYKLLHYVWESTKETRRQRPWTHLRLTNGYNRVLLTHTLSQLVTEATTNYNCTSIITVIFRSCIYTNTKVIYIYGLFQMPIRIRIRSFFSLGSTWFSLCSPSHLEGLVCKHGRGNITLQCKPSRCKEFRDFESFHFMWSFQCFRSFELNRQPLMCPSSFPNTTSQWFSIPWAKWLGFQIIKQLQIKDI